MSVINLGRTSRTNIAFYQTDGMGRDDYINYNNAGFWKDKLIKVKISYPHKKFAIFHSLIHQAAPFTYYSDGSGRDSYVLENNGGLVKPFEPLAKENLAKYLRTGEDKHILKNNFFLTKRQRRYLNKIKKIQDNVVSRLYNDSLEKIRKNNFQCRNNSINDFFKRDKFRPISGTLTPKNNSMSINYIHSHQNFRGNLKEKKEKLMNLKANSYRNKNILEKYIKSSNDINNNENKKVKLLKNLRLNSSELKCNFITDNMLNKNNNNIKEYTNNHCLSPTYSINKRLMFGYENNIKKSNKNKEKNMFNINSFGSFSATNRNNIAGNMKSIYNLRKKNNIKKYILSNGNNLYTESTNTKTKN